MSKAERRKRSRQRQKERERVAPAAVQDASGQTRLAASSEAASLPPVVPAPEESGYITGPIAPRAPAPVRAVHLEVPGLIDEPIDAEFEDGDGQGDEDDEDEAEAGGDDDDDEDSDDEDSDEGEDDGDDDEDDDPIEDAVFNVACGAVEQGDKLTWKEVIACLCMAEIDDPRLGFLVAMLFEQDGQGQPLPPTGARVIRVLAEMGMEDLIDEARETSELPDGAGDTPEERAVVRTNARELKAQAQAALGDKPAPRGNKPFRASELRNRQTALGAVVPVSVGRASR